MAYTDSTHTIYVYLIYMKIFNSTYRYNVYYIYVYIYPIYMIKF